MVGLPAHQIARLGLGYVPENRDIFPRLTVEQNLLLGVKPGQRGGRWSLQDMYELFPRLKERARVEAGQLSGGEQQMLTLCRTLMGDPDLIIVDEPTEGLAPVIVEALTAVLIKLRGESGLSIILVEQNIKLTLELADDIAIINTGSVVFRGEAKGIKLDDAVVTQHLGVF